MQEGVVLNEEMSEQALTAMFAALDASNESKFLWFFHRFKDQFPEAVMRVALSFVGQGKEDCRQAEILSWLAQAPYFPCLADCQLFELPEARHAAKWLKNIDARFFVKIASIEQDCGRNLLRALEIVEALDDCDVLISWLKELTNHQDSAVCSKAAKVICRIRPSKVILDRQLRSTDARKRANAIEALWEGRDNDAVPAYYAALDDPSHRVVVNALIGLYLMAQPGALETLLSLAGHPCEAYRCSAIWAYGHLGDARAIPTLQELKEDESERVRKSAEEQLRRIRRAAIAGAVGTLPEASFSAAPTKGGLPLSE